MAEEITNDNIRTRHTVIKIVVIGAFLLLSLGVYAVIEIGNARRLESEINRIENLPKAPSYYRSTTPYPTITLRPTSQVPVKSGTGKSTVTKKTTTTSKSSSTQTQDSTDNAADTSQSETDPVTGAEPTDIPSSEPTAVPTQIPTAIPTQIPDNTPPVINGINGPYTSSVSSQVCFNVGPTQISDTNPGNYQFSWKIDITDWTGYSPDDSVYCFNINESYRGNVWLRVKDRDGNESLPYSMPFQYSP